MACINFGDGKTISKYIPLHVPEIEQLSLDQIATEPADITGGFQLSLTIARRHNDLAVNVLCCAQRDRDAYDCLVFLTVTLFADNKENTVFRYLPAERKSGESWSHGWDRFMEWQRLTDPNESFVAADGSILLEAEVTITKRTFSKFDDPTACEHTLSIGDRHFYVSKYLLAEHSAFFRTLFFGNWFYRKSKATLADVDPDEFLEFLRFLQYPDYVTSTERIGTVLALADRFCADVVRERCQIALLLQSNNPSSIPLRMAYAIKYDLKLLVPQCYNEARNVGWIPKIDKLYHQLTEKFDEDVVVQTMCLLQVVVMGCWRDPNNSKETLYDQKCCIL